MKIATNKERLIELFDADPRNDTAIAEQFGVSKQAVSAWRNGTRSPKKTVLIEIANYYKVSIEWLMGFDVPKRPAIIDMQLFGRSGNEDPQIRLVVNLMETMTDEQKQQVVAIVRAFAYSSKPEKKE